MLRIKKRISPARKKIEDAVKAILYLLEILEKSNN